MFTNSRKYLKPLLILSWVCGLVSWYVVMSVSYIMIEFHGVDITNNAMVEFYFEYNLLCKIIYLIPGIVTYIFVFQYAQYLARKQERLN